MIKYNVRSRQLVDLVSEVKRNKLILSPPFQRNLVWRTIHKIDFIKTILLGYPFPQIFLAKGELNVEELSTTSVVVDGQQRMNSILEFIENEYPVDCKYYRDLSKQDRDDFLKYEIALIELDMEADDSNIIEIFQRLNRTFYSLTKIEKLATEYAPSEFMLTAKLLTDEINLSDSKIKDMNITSDFKNWAKKTNYSSIVKLVLENNIFTPYEMSRKVHLMFMLNILGTIESGFFNRNIKDSLIEEYNDEYSLKSDIVKKLNDSAEIFLSLKLKKNSYWFNKANFFSLIIFICDNIDKVELKNTAPIKTKLEEFEENTPVDYALAAKEAVNNKKERLIRNKHLEELLLK